MANRDIIYKIYDEEGNLEYKHIDLDTISLSELVTLKKRIRVSWRRRSQDD